MDVIILLLFLLVFGITIYINISPMIRHYKNKLILKDGLNEFGINKSLSINEKIEKLKKIADINSTYSNEDKVLAKSLLNYYRLELEKFKN